MRTDCCSTGTNACYMELLGRITKWLPHYRPRTPDMVVNIEWPGFQVSAEQLLSCQMTPSLPALGPWTSLVWMRAS